MRNAYPEKPVLEYRKTSVEMGLVIGYLQSLPVNIEIKRAAYIMFRFESANGRSGVNDNYVGAQADSGRWPEEFDSKITGIVFKKENGTGKDRIFIAFASWKGSIDFLVNRVSSRGLYVGGFAHLVAKMAIKDEEDLCFAYKRDWVTGKKAYIPLKEEIKSFLSIYRQSEKIFQQQ